MNENDVDPALVGGGATQTNELILAGIEAAPVGTYVLDDRLRIRYVNEQALVAFGEVNPLIGREMGEVLAILWPAESARNLVAIFRHTLATGEPHFSPRFTACRADSGIEETYEWELRRIVTVSGASGLVCYFQNLTERQLVDDALRLSEERLRTLISVVTDIPWRTDAEGAFVEPQGAWERYTGQSWEEHRGDGWAQAFHPDDRVALNDRWREAVRGEGDGYAGGGRLWHAASGTWRFVMAKAMAIRSPDGSVREWVGACTDVDDSRRALADVERVSRAKDDFLAALSHELRTPLTPVLMTASVMEGDPSHSEDVREAFAMIRRNVELEARLIDDLLDLTRISHGKLQLELVPTDLHVLLRRTLEIVGGGTAGARIEVELGASDYHAKVDSARMQQVFWNLLKNALKFTPVGGRVAVATRNDGEGGIVVSVADSGVGISAEALPGIFRAFEQGDARGQMQFGGLGLGLAISAAIVEAHGGTIRAESEGTGQGSVFSILLSGMDAPPSPEEAKATVAVEKCARVLVVEDHDETRTVFERMLKRRGHVVTTAGSCAEARAAFERGEFDVVISDLGLPDGSGLDLMRALRAVREVPAIALSGYGMEEDQRQTAAAGFARHLVKPVDFQDLVRALDEVLG